MAILGVADDPKVKPVPLADILVDDGWPLVVKGLDRAPSIGIADVRVGRIGSVVILEDEVPEFLRGEEEDLGSSTIARSNGGLVKVVEGRFVGFGPISEVHVHHAPVACLRCCGKDVPVAVVEND